MHSRTDPPPTRSALVVDDSDTQRRHAATLCQQLGIASILEARDGHEALAVLDDLPAPPDLLIIDLEMPGMDGIELIEALRYRGLRVPIVLASAREGSLIESVSGMGSSVVAGLRKPLTPEGLRQAVDDAFQPKPERRRSPRLPITTGMLSQAIASGGIFPHFQPKVDTHTGILRGVEALARWQHPNLGAVPPDQFIPLAEREGLIQALTLSMMEQSFAQCATWNARGMRLSVAVNFSAKLLVDPQIVGAICDLQQRHDLHPSQVVLEVTESCVVDSAGAALGILARLRLKGFGLSIDDYGTGFSSMQQLARIPFTELKIDRTFVHEAHRRKGLRVILESALDLARGLELATVAEGVETLEDWRLLQSFGCTACQGWLIAKPMLGHELLPWTKLHHERLRELRAPSLP